MFKRPLNIKKNNKYILIKIKIIVKKLIPIIK